MIPKKIHYCWFGNNPLPPLAKKCIKSWKKYCPDYEIIRWDESNFDINYNLYVKQAYEQKKWAFVSDVARLHILYYVGGIYMDTDVELIKPIDNFLVHKSFSGFETKNSVPTGIMGSRGKEALFKEFLKIYDKRAFILSDKNLDLTTNVILMTNIAQKYGLLENGNLQDICGCIFYPVDYFCPKDLTTNKMVKTKNTCAIHHFHGSWVDDKIDGKPLIEKLKIFKKKGIKWSIAKVVFKIKKVG